MSIATARLTFVRGTLVLEGVRWAALKQAFPPGLWTWDSRADAWRCDALEYLAVRRVLRNHHLETVDLVPQWSRLTWPGLARLASRDDPLQNRLAARRCAGTAQFLSEVQVQSTSLHHSATSRCQPRFRGKTGCKARNGWEKPGKRGTGPWQA